MTSLPNPVRPSSTPEQTEYLHYMDAARGVLLLLGVVFHAAGVYSSDGAWLVSDGALGSLEVLRSALHLFRMPAFFLIAGFFSLRSLSRASASSFLRSRVLRLGVPFLAAAVLLNLPQLHLLQTIDHSAVRALPTPLPHGFWFTDGWILHLWFLLYLLVYSGILALLTSNPSSSRLIARACARIDIVFQRQYLAWVLVVCASGLLAVTGATLVHFVPLLAEPWPWIGYPMMLIRYAIYFSLGVALFRFAPLYRAFLRPSALLVLASAALLSALPWIMTPEAGLGSAALHRFVRAVAVTVLCQWVLLAFHMLADRPSGAFRGLADASYSVYLFHHIIVMLLAVALLGYTWHPALKFAVVLVCASALSYVIHVVLIKRVPLLRLLFNGKPRARRVAPAAEAAGVASS